MDNRNKFSWILAAYIVVLALSLALFGLGIYLAMAQQAWPLLAAGCIGLIVVLATWPLAALLNHIANSGLQQQENLIGLMSDRLQQISVMLNLISEQQLLSDRAKAVAFREKDRDALLRAIQEEIARHDYEAAMVLAGDYEIVFGYKQEADRLRSEIQARKHEAITKQINEAHNVIERHIRGENWAEAFREAERVAEALPNSEVAKRMPNEVNLRREAHKKQLMDSFRDADARNDYEAGVEILRRLDMYLTPAEAKGLQEKAQNIFKNRMQALANAFRANFQDKPAEAIRVGEMIMQEFPTSRMAQEVRDQMEKLRSRAAATAVPQPA